MIDKRTVQEILTDLAINKNLKGPSNVAYHGTGARFYQYDPSFALTGEGANAYGRGFYSGSIPEIGEFYKNLADSQGKQGTVYQVNLPEQYKYYNTDLPLAKQSTWVQDRLKGLAQPVDVPEFNYDLARTNRFDTVYDDFFKSRGYYPKYINEMVNFVNEHPERYMKEIFNPASASSGKYSQLNRTLKDLGIVGTTHYKPNGANVNITFDPKDIGIIQPYEVGPRMIADSVDTNKSLAKMIQGYKRAFNTSNRTILSNPYLKPALKSLGTTLGAAGVVGDAATIYEAGKYANKKIIEDYDNLSIKQKELIGNHIGMNPRRGQDWSGLNLPLVQVNNDGSPNVALQGGINYDDYYIEPLGDDVYVKRRKMN